MARDAGRMDSDAWGWPSLAVGPALSEAESEDSALSQATTKVLGQSPRPKKPMKKPAAAVKSGPTSKAKSKKVLQRPAAAMLPYSVGGTPKKIVEKQTDTETDKAPEDHPNNKSQKTAPKLSAHAIKIRESKIIGKSLVAQGATLGCSKCRFNLTSGCKYCRNKAAKDLGTTCEDILKAA